MSRIAIVAILVLCALPGVPAWLEWTVQTPEDKFLEDMGVGHVGGLADEPSTLKLLGVFGASRVLEYSRMLEDDKDDLRARVHKYHRSMFTPLFAVTTKMVRDGREQSKNETYQLIQEWLPAILFQSAVVNNMTLGGALGSVLTEVGKCEKGIGSNGKGIQAVQTKLEELDFEGVARNSCVVYAAASFTRAWAHLVGGWTVVGMFIAIEMKRGNFHFATAFARVMSMLTSSALHMLFGWMGLDIALSSVELAIQVLLYFVSGPMLLGCCWRIVVRVAKDIVETDAILFAKSAAKPVAKPTTKPDNSTADKGDGSSYPGASLSGTSSPPEYEEYPEFNPGKFK